MRYIINEKEKIVVAIMENTEWDVVDFLVARGRIIFGGFYRKFKINKSYKGIAKCHPNDEFDAAKGIELASARAILKHNEAFTKKIEEYYIDEKETLDKLKIRSEKKLQRSIEKMENINY